MDDTTNTEPRQQEAQQAPADAAFATPASIIAKQQQDDAPKKLSASDAVAEGTQQAQQQQQQQQATTSTSTSTAAAAASSATRVASTMAGLVGPTLQSVGAKLKERSRSVSFSAMLGATPAGGTLYQPFGLGGAAASAAATAASSSTTTAITGDGSGGNDSVGELAADDQSPDNNNSSNNNNNNTNAATGANSAASLLSPVPASIPPGPLSDVFLAWTSKFRQQSDRLAQMEGQVAEEKRAIDSHKVYFDARIQAQRQKLEAQDVLIDSLEQDVRGQEQMLAQCKREVELMLARQQDLEAQLKRQKFLQRLAMPDMTQFEDGAGETFGWVVRGVAAKRQRCDEIFSPEFCSRKYHYTFRIKVRMNGSGALNEGSMSCGLNIRKGKADNEAKWPFDLRFTVSVIDVMGHIAESASINAQDESDDTKAIAFRRPEDNNDMSRGWGNFLTWADHDLDNVVVNDTVYLELYLARPE